MGGRRQRARPLRCPPLGGRRPAAWWGPGPRRGRAAGGRCPVGAPPAGAPGRRRRARQGRGPGQRLLFIKLLGERASNKNVSFPVAAAQEPGRGKFRDGRDVPGEPAHTQQSCPFWPLVSVPRLPLSAPPGSFPLTAGRPTCHPTEPLSSCTGNIHLGFYFLPRHQRKPQVGFHVNLHRSPNIWLSQRQFNLCHHILRVAEVLFCFVFFKALTKKIKIKKRKN